MPITLLDQVADIENIYSAYKECSRGKRLSYGYLECHHNIGEHLLRIQKLLKSGEPYPWGGYREFYVCDPKRRLVMAAPFLDRVVHHAIHRVIEPLIDPLLSDWVYACRKNKGNRACALKLLEYFKRVEQNRYVIKLDVRKYFDSINHDILLTQLRAALPDSSLNILLYSLVKSHQGYAKLGRGIPIGNLTSQLFANFNLQLADQTALEVLGIPYHGIEFCHALYLRYMDDMVIVASTKKLACEAAHEVCRIVASDLKLDIPFQKRMHLAFDPVPFLGYRIDHTGAVALKRKYINFNRKFKKLKSNPNVRLSTLAQVQQSFDAWKGLE